jgi:hypothetical protein
VLDKSGGVDKVFTQGGNLRDPKRTEELINEEVYVSDYAELGEGGERIKEHFVHRGTLEHYISGVDRRLTDSFIKSVKSIVEDGAKVVLLVDTYEMLGGLDEWMCETFVKGLPSDAKIIILSRDILSRKNPDWSQYSTTLMYHELQELSEEEAKEYLRYHKCPDKHLDLVYKFTKGYPLCLALAVDLAKQLRGGWEEVRGFKAPAYQDRIASELLERILRQPGVEEVREFLEKGVVADWFDAGVVSHLLGVSPEEGRAIYEKMGQFSFVHPHPKGLQFHDTVREILKVRLKLF